ncbi:adenylate/guanylate cyclase domain-containing protein [Bacterioplanoides sp. SCSIO 12839]|uniref:adenylate/guanylate cyclase domain-containing protein n=1 Tax=Bacterioplanoides sp. SCSIO 12839 TaxID=2829569 RepID=UPI0021074896|nr:adenylate/guanylate cyclase domain-containing protein [Bacterioplanoides sp. SCSIO 12839]UTW47568.1 adenylate/guanylate cyclase domain-containing protein [Bacterioplanoides sp. SCSIO 12839]
MTKFRSMWQKLNLSQVCGLFAAGLILITGLSIGLLTYQHQLSQAEGTLRTNAALQLQRLALTLAPSLLNEDRVSLNLTLNEWQLDHSIPAIRILNPQQQLIATSGRFSQQGERIYQEITQDNLAIGTLQANLDTSSATNAARRYLSISLFISALLASLGAWISYHLTEKNLKFLRQLPEQLKEWKDGETLAISQPDSAEFLPLYQALTDISEQEQQRRMLKQALDQFINNDNQHDHSTDFCYQNCALLYVEILDLEVLQSRLSAQELSTLLNHYHRLLSQAAKLYNGKLDRFQGDGIVMLFGMPGPDQQNMVHSLYAAMLFLGLVDYIRENNHQLLPLEFRIAAHYGPILLAPIGEEQNIQGNLIGDTIHWAARLAQSGEERRLLVSQSMLDKVKDIPDLQWQEGHEVADLHGCTQYSYWLDKLPEKNQSLIKRQIKHIVAMTEPV